MIHSLEPASVFKESASLADPVSDLNMGEHDVALTLLVDASVALKLRWPSVTFILNNLLGRLREGRVPDQVGPDDASMNAVY